MSNTDSKFMQDEELRSLLNKWGAPEASGALDQRVAASYQQAMSSAHPSSVLEPQRDNEVVKMKFCNTCQEQFADRFSFCPVDGTPLSTPAPVPTPTTNASAADVEASYPMSESSAAEKPRAIVPPPPVTPAPVTRPAPVVTPAPLVTPAPASSSWTSSALRITPDTIRPRVRTARPGAAAAHQMIGEYHITMLEDRGLLPRL